MAIEIECEVAKTNLAKQREEILRITREKLKFEDTVRQKDRDVQQLQKVIKDQNDALVELRGNIDELRRINEELSMNLEKNKQRSVSGLAKRMVNKFKSNRK